MRMPINPPVPATARRVKYDPIAAIMTALQNGKSAAINVIGDSTGNGTDEWVYNLGVRIGAALPRIRVVHKLWSDATQDYGAWTVIQAGTNGERGLVLGGTRGRYWADGEVTTIASDILLKVKVALTDWSSGAEQTLVSHYGSAGNRGWRLCATAGGTLFFEWSTDGTAVITQTTASAPPLTDGQAYWIRASLDVDNGAGGYAYDMSYSTDDTNWTSIRSITGGATTSIFNSTASVEVGSRGTTTNPATGTVYEVEIRAGHKDSPGEVLCPQGVETLRSFTSSDGNSISGAPTLYIVNGSHSGAGLTYLTDATRFPKMCQLYYPSLVIFSTSHNDGAAGASTWFTSLDGVKTQVQSRNPGAALAFLMQSARNSPAGNLDDHAQRMAMLPTWCARNGVEVIDGHSCFYDANGAVIASYVDSGDGIHPSAAGKIVQNDAIARQFLAFVR